jgi:hypothetical protein
MEMSGAAVTGSSTRSGADPVFLQFGLRAPKPAARRMAQRASTPQNPSDANLLR